jgi:hypothetical protein
VRDPRDDRPEEQRETEGRPREVARSAALIEEVPQVSHPGVRHGTGGFASSNSVAMTVRGDRGWVTRPSQAEASAQPLDLPSQRGGLAPTPTPESVVRQGERERANPQVPEHAVRVSRVGAGSEGLPGSNTPARSLDPAVRSSSGVQDRVEEATRYLPRPGRSYAILTPGNRSQPWGRRGSGTDPAPQPVRLPGRGGDDRPRSSPPSGRHAPCACASESLTAGRTSDVQALSPGCPPLGGFSHPATDRHLQFRKVSQAPPPGTPRALSPGSHSP